MVSSLCDGKCVCEKCAWCTVYVTGSVHIDSMHDEKHVRPWPRRWPSEAAGGRHSDCGSRGGGWPPF